MRFPGWVAEHRRSVLFFFTLLAIVGIVNAFKLPVALFPHINFPRIVVNVDSGDRPAQQMEIAVTRKLETAIRPVPGVRTIRSTTSRGSAEISINFDWGDNMPVKQLEVESAVNQTLPSLPAGTTFTTRRMDPTIFPVAAYSLTSDKISLVALRDYAKLQLVPLVSAIKGVAKVAVLGGNTEEYRVEVNPDKLKAYGLTLQDVQKAVSANNVLKSVGRMEDKYRLYLLLTDTRIHDINDIKKTVIKAGDNGVITLSEVAKVYDSIRPNWVKVTANQHNAVLLLIYQQPNANTIQLVKDVKQKLAKLPDAPKGLSISNWYDQSDLIIASASSVLDAILIGVGLAALVLLIFLRSAKITLIAIFTVPAVLATTSLLLYINHGSFNIMSLGGMAAAVGLIVDDAIVMMEHIIRKLREQSETEIHHRIRSASLEFTRPLAGSSLATVIIFAPLAFLTGVTGAFFKALSFTMASSLIISFFIAWLAVPLLAEHLLKQKDALKEDTGAIFKFIQKKYQFLMRIIISKPVLVMLLIIPLLIVGYISFKQVGTGFMPHMDEGGFVLDYRAKAGTSLTETNRLLDQVEKILMANPAVATYSRRTGAQLGGGITESNEGDYFVKLKPFPRESVDKVMDEIRTQINNKVPGLKIDMALLMEDLIGDLTSVPQPIEIKLFSNNFNELLKTAPEIAKAISKIRGVVDINDGVVLAGDAVKISVNREKAAIEGVNPDQVQQKMLSWLNGVVTTQVQKGVKMVGIRVWVPHSRITQINQIAKLLITAPDGHQFPLGRIATISIDDGQPQITRENLKRMVAVTARISGRDMGSTIKAIKQMLNKGHYIKRDMYYELGGLYKQQQIAFKGMIQVFMAALGLVFLLLLFLYEKFSTAIAVLLMPLLAVSAVFFGLFTTGIELNITAMMGMTMIVGIVTEVSIFYFSEYFDLLKSGMRKNEALITAGINRMRPITMTTIAAILALLPLALSLGQGAAMQQPLAVAIISGLIIQIPLVVVIMPVIYKMLSFKTDT